MIHYIGVVLDQKSHQDLLTWWLNTVGPTLEVVYAHHMTLVHKPSEEDAAAYPAGQEVPLKVVGFDHDARGQAVLVDTSMKSRNAYPHITVSTEKGTRPVYSNDLLARRNHVCIDEGPVLTGTVMHVPY